MISNQFVAIKTAICLLRVQDINHAAVNALSLLLKDVILRLSSQLTEEMSLACRELLALAFQISLERGDRLAFKQDDIIAIHMSNAMTVSPSSVSSTSKNDIHLESAITSVVGTSGKLLSPELDQIQTDRIPDHRVFTLRSYNPEGSTNTPLEITISSPSNISDISTPTTDFISPASPIRTFSISTAPISRGKSVLVKPVRRTSNAASVIPILPVEPDAVVGEIEPDDNEPAEVKPVPSIKEILENEDYLITFTRFVKQNAKKDYYLLEFMRDVKEFEMETGTTDSALQARELIDRFIKPNMETSIPMTDTLRESIVIEYGMNVIQPRKDIFRPAIDICIELLSVVYDQFVESEEVKQIL
jgi:hypothetical protein